MMHEGTLINELVHKVAAIAEAEHAQKVTVVAVRVGDFSHVSPDHLREHFEHAARGTIVQGARLDIDVVHDTNDPLALEVMLNSVEIEE
jgi:hydrogenase nickel incorporation protein HypA/HybF